MFRQRRNGHRRRAIPDPSHGLSGTAGRRATEQDDVGPAHRGEPLELAAQPGPRFGPAVNLNPGSDVDAGATQADRESGRTPSASSPPGARRDSPSHIIAQPRGWAAPSSAVPKSTTARRCGTAASFTRSGTGRFRTAAPAGVRTLCSCGRPFGPTASRAPASQQTEPLPGGCGRAPERACQLRGRGDAVLAKEGQDVDVAGLEAEARQGRQARGSRTGGGLLADEMDRVS